MLHWTVEELSRIVVGDTALRGVQDAQCSGRLADMAAWFHERSLDLGAFVRRWTEKGETHMMTLNERGFESSETVPR